MNLHTSLDGFWKSEMKTLVLLEPALELLDFWNQQNIEKTLIYSRIFLHKIITKHIGFSTSSIRIHPNFAGRSATRKSYSEFHEVIATNQPVTFPNKVGTQESMTKREQNKSTITRRRSCPIEKENQQPRLK